MSTASGHLPSIGDGIVGRDGIALRRIVRLAEHDHVAVGQALTIERRVDLVLPEDLALEVAFRYAVLVVLRAEQPRWIA